MFIHFQQAGRILQRLMRDTFMYTMLFHLLVFRRYFEAIIVGVFSVVFHSIYSRLTCSIYAQFIVIFLHFTWQTKIIKQQISNSNTWNISDGF